MSDQIVKTCIDRAIPDGLILKAMEMAIAENPLNAPAINPRSLLPGVFPTVPRVFLAAITGKLWKPGRTLRVHFLDGDEEVQERVKPFAHIWSDYANIKFDFVDDPEAEIRISFKYRGSWSYLGTDALVIAKDQPTMNFGWLTKSSPNDEYSRVVTHEFGHALGAIHEHQNPAANIPWNKDAVYEYYMGPPNFWTREQVDINLFTRYGADITQFSEFDPNSIMLYPIPNEFTIGDFEVGWNKTLSDMDTGYISVLYPAEEKPENELTIDGDPIEASIGEFGEVDTFVFTITEAGTYRIETEGRTDVVVSLFGPDDETTFITQDDDSGRRLNARIVVDLGPGGYTVRVRHYSKRRTGEYTIGVYKEEA